MCVENNLNQNSDAELASPLNDSAEVAPLSTPIEAAVLEGSQLQIPNFVPDIPPWTDVDYRHSINGSGAHKLADSAVAPLVAAARGYRRIVEENHKNALADANLHSNSNQYKSLKSMILDGHDAMAMPWFSAAHIAQSRRDGTAQMPVSWQFRPSQPEKYDLPKYAFAAKAVTPIDVHPATPTDWLDETPTVLFAEGLLKGDSALSAYLHAHGASWEELSWDGVGNPVHRLTEVMNQIPAEKRILIMSLAGVHNTHQNPVDYREVRLKDRAAWIGFDADYSSNYQVHAAAIRFRNMLHRTCKMKSIEFLFPEVSTKDGTVAKAGIDDFLAHTGDWNALVKTLHKDLGDAPPRTAEDRVGNWRVSSNGTEVEECIAVPDPIGGGVGSMRWDHRIDMGGRITNLEVLRQPTMEEMNTGEFASDVKPYEIQDSSVEIELEWMEGDIKESATVEGPDKILNYPPDQWERRGAYIPQDVLRHTEWPPTAVRGAGLLKAIKGANREKQQKRTRWMQMGWVPQPGGHPVFLIGGQVIGELTASDTVVAGITDRELAPARHYGVGNVIEGADFRNEDYRMLVREDLNKVYDTFIGSGAWTDPAVANLVVAGGLRAAIPLRPVCTYYLTGEKGSGKSWTAQKMMAFWAKNLHDWMDNLPGSAKDTVPYTENAISVTPIWVMDDLAPSASAKQSELEQTKIADVIRSVFNNTAKGRMNADMTSRAVKNPIAQLVITAENTLNVASARERVIHLSLGRGALHPRSEPTDEVNRLQSHDGAPARLTQHLIRWVQFEASRPETGASWEKFMTSLVASVETIKKQLKVEMNDRGAKGGSLERIATLASDALLPYFLLQRMADFVGCDPDLVENLDLMNMADPVIDLLVYEHTENQTTNPGVALSRALSRLLRQGYAHVASPASPLEPPIKDMEDGRTFANTALGWIGSGQDDQMKPSGPRIGLLLDVKGNKDQAILFDLEVAFALAQKHYPDLIPHGQGQKVSQRALWNEGIAGGWKRQKDGNVYRDIVRVSVGNNTRSRGVPIMLGTVLNGGTVVNVSETDDESGGAEQ